jgi:chromate transporter
VTISRPEHPTFWHAFRYWLRLGFISFGGPAGQIAVMHRELVEEKRWISERRFLHALNYCMVLPGPEAQQLTIYIGWLLHRSWGGIVAGTLFVLPSLALLIALSWIYLAYGQVAIVQGIFSGIKPAVVAIVVFAAWRIGSRTLKNSLLRGFTVASFCGIFLLDIPFPAIVLVAGLAGYFGSRLAPEKFRVGGHGGVDKHYGPALIDDDTPSPEHALFRARRLAVLLLVGLTLWGGTLLLLPTPVLRDMGLFFSQAALVTFGGAYAVLPYVYQGGVETYGWLTGPQMIDGLALGETTPGPLIMVVAFVGFIGGWSKEILGPDALFLAGAAGALVATWFTFLPSFIFILAGAPLVEATHGDPKFTAPLTGITAAVVGVILNLALFFAWHVVWPHAVKDAPFSGGMDITALLIALGAGIALFRYKADTIRVIAACASTGLFSSQIFTA